jgi:hypothetical protein
MTTILVVDIGERMLRSASRLTERRTTTFGCFRLMKYATEIRFSDLRVGFHPGLAIGDAF